MLRFAGLDVHKRVVQACILDPDGGLLHVERFDLDASTLRRFALQHLGPDAAVALEATTNTWALVELLRPLVGEVVVSNPLKTRAIAEATVKTDQVDARTLADLLRCNYLPRVWQPDLPTQQRRRLSSRRSALVADRTAIKNRIHALLAMRLLTPGFSELFSTQGLRWLEQLALDEPGRQALDSDLRLLAAVEQEIALLDQQLAVDGYRQPAVKLLMTLPGVDVTAAQTLLAAWGEVERFHDGDQAASYLGLVPRTRQSAERCYQGPITKAGNGPARWVLVQAAQHLGRHPGPLGVFFRRLKQKKGHNVAVVAAARKLAVIAWRMLTRNEPYRYAQPKATEQKLQRLRVKATGRKRRSGPRPASVRGPKQGEAVRRVRSLVGVLDSEGLPPLGPVAAAEARVVEEQGVQEYVESLRRETVRPRSRPRKKDASGEGAGGSSGLKEPEGGEVVRVEVN